MQSFIETSTGSKSSVLLLNAQRNPEIDSGQKHGNIPALASTVQKTKRWISELMTEVTETFVTPNSQLVLHLPLNLGLAGKGVRHEWHCRGTCAQADLGMSRLFFLSAQT